MFALALGGLVLCYVDADVDVVDVGEEEGGNNDTGGRRRVRDD